MKILLLLALLLFPLQAQAYTPEQILIEVNKHRSTPLVMNPTLSRAAQDKANQLVACGCLEHTLGRPFYMTIQDHQISYLQAGENLARGYKDTKSLTRAWLNSPSHRKNMLALYTETGIAIAQGKYKGQNRVYVVQLFITPLTQTNAAKTN